ncbi:MAG: DUF2232 domain-containing protein [Spirochaetia bacterium]|nr:DUF2232 domain-containing protein [Spirochaetia bacterium]
MDLRAIPREWTEIAIFTVAAFLLYQINVLFFLITVPLIVLGLKRGPEAVLYSGTILLFAILVQVFIRTRGIEDEVLRRFFFMMEAAYPTALILGAALLFWGRGRILYRLLSATAAVLLVSLPIVGIYSGNQEVMEFLQQQFKLILESLQGGLGGNEAGANGVEVLSAMDAESFYTLISEVFIRHYIFSFFLMLSACWAFSYGIYSRSKGSMPYNLVHFTVPENLLWPFIGAWFGVLLDVLVGVPLVGFLFWNYGMILLSVYAMQGIGIMKSLFQQHGVSRLLQLLVVFSAVIILLTPRLNLVLIVGVPLLGLSEYWIHYRAGHSATEGS